MLHLDYRYSSLIPQYPRIDTQALDHLIKSIMSVRSTKFLERVHFETGVSAHQISRNLSNSLSAKPSAALPLFSESAS